VKGSVDFIPRQRCHFNDVVSHGHGRSRPGPLRTFFFAESISPAAGLNFEVSSEEGDDDAEFSVFEEEKHGNLDITRRVDADAPVAAFAVDPSLSSATIAPPAPFSGSATFQQIDDHTSRWEGSLSVPLPGLPVTPLTGRSFSWGLSQFHD
jgi:hypothetical protein